VYWAVKRRRQGASASRLTQNETHSAAVETITLKQGGQCEAWLTVYGDGRLKLHIVNDRYAFRGTACKLTKKE
jgi:hypothetical protein